MAKAQSHKVGVFKHLFPQYARSTIYYRMGLVSVLDTLVDAGRIEVVKSPLVQWGFSTETPRDVKSKRKATTICAWISRQKDLQSDEAIIRAYDQFRDRPMYFFRSASNFALASKFPGHPIDVAL